jgi:uncharacterized membrane protein (UPF0127 family)
LLQVRRVKFCLITLAGAVLVVCGCKDAKTASSAESAPPPPAAPSSSAILYYPYAQTNLQRMKIYVGASELDSALALQPLERQTGMMWRTNMAENEAMLFPFPFPHRASFYMRNTRVPLSAAYIDPEGVIQEIHDLQPLNETPAQAGSDNIQYVLEVKQGWFRRHNVTTGAVVRTPHGELSKTFSFRQ